MTDIRDLTKKEDNPFMANKHTLTYWVNECHRNAEDHGWWDETRTIPELLCLVHSEVSEALEAFRNGDVNGFREEIADMFIRLADMCGGLGIDLETEVATKHLKNCTRPYRHGNNLT